ncbi:MAG: M23 family metallopeptidase [Firmicutes bacterium]|nr:M23 family metallopeptidase [Bacillota bacterium]
MGKKFILVIIVVIVFIPTFIAVGYYSYAKSEPTASADVSSLEIRDLNGTVWTFTSGDGTSEADEMIELFVNMRTNATAVSSLPEALSGTYFFYVTMTSFDVTSTYSYYFSTTPSDTYVVDSSGNAYKVAEEDAAEFLVTKYAVSLYSNTSVPTIEISGYRVTADSATWNYAVYDGTFLALDTSSLTSASDGITYNVSGGLLINFSETPDYANVKVISSEETIFDDIIDNISNLSLDGVSEFSVEVSAEWYETSSRGYYGTAHYEFSGNLTEAAVFYLGQTTVENGKFVCIAGKNVDDVTRIGFSSEPSINYTPIFFEEGDYVYALIPISYELEDGEDHIYTFTITYNGVSQEMNLNVTSYAYGSSNSSITEAVENATYNEEALAEAEEILGALADTEILEEHMFSGTFLEDVVGEDSTSLISPGFGRYITVSATGTTFRHTGVDYNVAEGTDVYAVNDGVVVYSGYLTTTGYIVVVDHGWGLKSWYCHLSSCSVAVGDTVSKGDVVGLSGDTGFAASNRTHIGLTVFDVPVCIYDLWENELAIPNME